MIIVNSPHHVTQKGNYGGVIFSNDNYREYYLSLVGEYSRRYELALLAYCLLPNHVHFIVIPAQEYSLAKVFNLAHMRYTQYVNKRKKASGHLWQGRFRSCVLDSHCLSDAIKYVERNPARLKLVKKPGEWEWSSAAAHTGERHSVALKDIFPMVSVNASGWSKYINGRDDVDFLNTIRKQTRVGRPVGLSAFITTLESRFGKKLVDLRRGRPVNRVLEARPAVRNSFIGAVPD
jgi:putative transposase